MVTPESQIPFLTNLQRLLSEGSFVATFDTRYIDSVPYAPSTQVYIELSAGDKRQQEVAEQVQKLILQELTQ